MITRRTQETKLSERSQVEQAVIMAMLTRNQFAVDYWSSHLPMVCELPIYRHEVKQLYNRIQREVSTYNIIIQSLFKRKHDGIDGYEMLLDSTCEFHRDVARMVYLYEQAMIRAFHSKGLQNVELLCHLATAQYLINTCACACSMEFEHMQPNIRPLLAVGTPCMEVPCRMEDEEGQEKIMPSNMGHFSRLAFRINKAIFDEMGMRYEELLILEIDDAEVQRSMEICAKNIISAMMNYELINAMFQGNGKTLEEAKEFVEERRELFRQELAKAEEKKRLKEAKKQYKQTKNKSNEN